MSKFEELIAAVLTAHPEDDRMRALALEARAERERAREADFESRAEIAEQHVVSLSEERDFLREQLKGTRLLREMLAIRCAGATSLYMDEGELQDNHCIPCIDFKRDEPELIREKLLQRALATSSAKAHLTGDTTRAVLGEQGLPVWRGMDCAPLDGTLVRLLVRFDHPHGIEDTDEPTATIGSHNDGEWNFVGWDWYRDEWTRGGGDLLGWLPMYEAAPAPIDMVLHCPACGLQHIDAPDERTPNWINEPHRSHLCHNERCGHIWRPADVPTNGVAAVKTKGGNDSPIKKPAQGGAVPPDVLEAAQSFVDNGYRGPLAYASKVFDWVASLGAGA